MRLRRPHPSFRARHALAVAVVLAQVVAATGAPVLAPQKHATASPVPYPCQGHACACTSSELSWAGDCCCFTLEQKLAWAEAQGIEPPEHVRPMVEARKARKAKAKPKSCCAKSEKPSCCSAPEPAEPKHEGEPPAPPVKWVAVMFAQKCRGESPVGLFDVEAGVAPVLPIARREPRQVPAFARPADTHARSTSFRPPTPPPRVS
ncbi:MAG: hypothetical protein J0I06_15795 [Planctomycetes bacterium]|nr:hypothetical protein [Planctomycetota bacterium]